MYSMLLAGLYGRASKCGATILSFIIIIIEVASGRLCLYMYMCTHCRECSIILDSLFDALHADIIIIL